MLGQHFFGGKFPVPIKATGDDALPFAEQVGKDARKGNGYGMVAVGEYKLNLDFSWYPFHTSGYDQAAEPNPTIGRWWRGLEFGCAVEVHQVLLKNLSRHDDDCGDTENQAEN
jgi:hypothetical protein